MPANKQSPPSVRNPRPKYGMGLEFIVLPGRIPITRTIIGMRFEYYGIGEWEYQLGRWDDGSWGDGSWESESSVTSQLSQFGKPEMSPEDILRNEG